ncbi:hypothetical protein T265_15699, partial [Opisthorchis viverrini]
ANVFHTYHLLRANKLPAENIITFADIANNPENPFPGQVFHDTEHENIYKGVEIDYRGEEVNSEIFAKVLEGDTELEKQGKKVLKSGPGENVFIYYSGHGTIGYISFSNGKLSATQLNDILAKMRSKKV